MTLFLPRVCGYPAQLQKRRSI